MYAGRKNSSLAPQDTPCGGPGEGNACKVKDPARELIRLSPSVTPIKGLEELRDTKASSSSPPMPVIHNVFSLAPYQEYLEKAKGTDPILFCKNHQWEDSSPQNTGGSQEPAALRDVSVVSSLRLGTDAVQSQEESCYRSIPKKPKPVPQELESQEGRVGTEEPPPKEIVLGEMAKSLPSPKNGSKAASPQQASNGKEIWLAFQDVAALLSKLLSQLKTFTSACPFPHVVRAGAIFIPIHVVKEKLFPKLPGSFVDQVLQKHKVELRPTTLSEEKHLRELELKSCTSRMLKLLAIKRLPEIYPDLLNLHWHSSIQQQLGCGTHRREHNSGRNCTPGENANTNTVLNPQDIWSPAPQRIRGSSPCQRESRELRQPKSCRGEKGSARCEDNILKNRGE
ncbi:uncharacterized protein C15orf39 homolog [Passer domesticus]|uniref:uncharacterized protein C15orf39 homolog n=1 Tax=Passer domesticus TaxID=48849 RepID=UPI0030FF2F6E